MNIQTEQSEFRIQSIVKTDSETNVQIFASCFGQPYFVVPILCQWFEKKLYFQKLCSKLDKVSTFRTIFVRKLQPIWKTEKKLELVSKELNRLAAILHVYARGFNFM